MAFKDCIPPPTLAAIFTFKIIYSCRTTILSAAVAGISRVPPPAVAAIFLLLAARFPLTRVIISLLQLCTTTTSSIPFLQVYISSFYFICIYMFNFYVIMLLQFQVSTLLLLLLRIKVLFN